MRNAFAAEVLSLAQKNDRVVLLSGDIGNKLFDNFKFAFPQQFYNCGVAEANMTGMAAGLALSGLRPITYTIAPFLTTRCLEQIKLDVCYQKAPVIIVGVGSGLSYAGLGTTHHSCDDIALLRQFPGMQVICPADSMELRLALQAALASNAPAYIRIGKKGESVIHQSEPHFTLGKGICVISGSDVCLLSTGTILPVVLEAAKELAGVSVCAEVVSMHTVKPLDSELLKSLFQRFSVLATIEEHNLAGGFGSAVAEWMVDNGVMNKRLVRFGVGDTFLHGTGNQKNARSRCGLTSANIADKLIKILKP